MNFYHSIILICVIVILGTGATEGQHRKLFPIKNENGKMGYIDTDGNWIISPKFDAVGNFSEGLAGVMIDRKWGVIDTTGSIMVQPQFTLPGKLPIYPLLFIDGLAAVSKYDNRDKSYKWGFIDTYGNWVIEPEYDYIRNFSEGMAVLGKDKGNDRMYTFVDKNGKFIYDFYFDGASDFSDGYGVVSFNKQNGYIGDNGRYFYDFDKDAKEKNVDGFINKDGKFLKNKTFYSARSFSEGKAAVHIGYTDGRANWGYIDTTGEFLTHTDFLSAKSFSSGLAKTTKRHNNQELTSFISIWKNRNGYSGYTNHYHFQGMDLTDDYVIDGLLRYRGGFIDPISELWIIKPNNYYVGDFTDGYASAQDKSSKKWGYIDKKGNYKVEPIFDEAEAFVNGLARVRFGSEDMSWGYVNKQGDLLPMEFAEYVKAKQKRLSR